MFAEWAVSFKYGDAVAGPVSENCIPSRMAFGGARQTQKHKRDEGREGKGRKDEGCWQPGKWSLARRTVGPKNGTGNCNRTATPAKLKRAAEKRTPPVG